MWVEVVILMRRYTLPGLSDLDGKAYLPGTRKTKIRDVYVAPGVAETLGGSFTLPPFRLSRKPKLIIVFITYEVIDAVSLSS